MFSGIVFARWPGWALPVTLVCFLLGFTIASALEAAGNSANRLAGPVAAVVERVVDGDTLAVRARIWPGQEVRVHVRVAGIDTPELHSRCLSERDLAARAREFTASFVRPGKPVENGALTDAGGVLLRDIRHDKFGGRVLAQVRNQEGADLAGALVQAGFARFYGGGRRAAWCPETQADIRRDEGG